MTFKEFVDSLAVLEIGASVVLTRQQFDTVFAGVQHEADRKQVALGMAELAGCRVMFGQSDASTATFTRRQERRTVRSGPRYASVDQELGGATTVPHREGQVPEFIVRRLGPHWVVVNNGVAFSRHSSEASAIASATGSATRAGLKAGPRRVILERENGSRELIWNSEDHADTRHEG